MFKLGLICILRVWGWFELTLNLVHLDVIKLLILACLILWNFGWLVSMILYVCLFILKDCLVIFKVDKNFVRENGSQVLFLHIGYELVTILFMNINELNTYVFDVVHLV